MSFPYDGIADYQNWSKAVTGMDSHRLDPQHGARFKISTDTKIASAGSCFARRIAKSLRGSGLNYYDAEPGPKFLNSEQRDAHGYGAYSARFGEVYTTLQLLQLLKRATGEFQPLETAWSGPNGLVDPFRPTIQPAGFSTLGELENDREHHLEAVRRMFAEADIFIFTMGLTETWCHADDGAAYPLCPGRGIGSFDSQKYRFRNLGVAENVGLLCEFVEALRELNPKTRVLLSVSPVPLAATIEDRHVLSASTYSKSVLVVAAQEARRRYENVDYFAAYEIVMGTFNTAEYFESDRRTVSQSAVEHVMRSFYEKFSDVTPRVVQGAAGDEASAALPLKPCDEDLLLMYLDRDFGKSK
ncbi:MAG TPA: GSCFA domain-containing protein [Candidatus Rubrimentiphilum sp.]|nr:GSCFA domain-containing protein [Candidatus Rubrimentiphilum sp.]